MGTALGIWLVLNFISAHLGWIENGWLYRLAMNAVHLLLYFFLMFNSIFVYRLMFIRGASLFERVAGSYVTPLAFVLKEIIRVSEFFSLGESLYYGLSPYPLLSMMIGQVGLIAISEMMCRYLYRKKFTADIRVITRIPVALTVISGVCTYFLLLWHLGDDAYWIHLAIYKLLFK